ncbi:MAG: hypothetical protein J6W52_05060 [Bacteroidaceae bacterium]|nr:hypothetical protein [Bacteroidaceae bacterium]
MKKMRLKVPDNMKDVNTMTGQFVLSFLATTISIALTFGSAHIVEQRKKKAEKREIVMMLMYDMQSTLKMLDECDSCLNCFFDKQVEILENPETFNDKRFDLVHLAPRLDYPLTLENIFTSSIETINTIGNTVFVESVSIFYDIRSKYKHEIFDDFIKNMQDCIANIDSLAAFSETKDYPLISDLYIIDLKMIFEQCKQMMYVSDEELQTFVNERYKLDKAHDTTIGIRYQQAAKENVKRLLKFEEALEKLEKANK